MNRFIGFFLIISTAVLLGCSGMTGDTAIKEKQVQPGEMDTGEPQSEVKTRWYANGEKAEEVDLINGRKTGNYKAWYKNGQLKIECQFKDDSLNGDFNAWFEDGRKRLSLFFDNGKRQGKWTRYHEKRDSIVAEMSFNDDKLDGHLSIAYEQGNGNGIGRSYALTSMFRNGAMVDSFQFDYTNTKGHTISARGVISENGDVKVNRQKNVFMTDGGKLTIDYGAFKKTYDSVDDFFIAEINLRVIPKFSLEFCNSMENLWPCQFPQDKI